MKGYELCKYLEDVGALNQEIYIGTRSGDMLSRLYKEDIQLVFADDIKEGDVVMILI